MKKQSLFVMIALAMLAKSVVIGLLVGPIRADLGISETQMSLLYGFVFALFYTGLGVPIAWGVWITFSKAIVLFN